MKRSYRIIKRKISAKNRAMILKINKIVAKEMGLKTVQPAPTYDYGLAEVFYNNNMKPRGRTEPDRWYETPEELVKDLALMFKDAKADIKRGVSVSVTEKSIKDSNPLTPKK